MQLEHSFVLPLAVDESWRVLRDLGSVAPSMPGSTVTSAAADEVQGSLKVKLGPLNVTYRGTCRLVSADDTARCGVVEAHGDSARSGSASATVEVALTGDDSSTTVALATDLELTGKPADFAQNVLSDVGTKLVTQFAATLTDALTAGTWTASGSGHDAADPDEAPAAPTTDEHPTADEPGTADETSTADESPVADETSDVPTFATAPIDTAPEPDPVASVNGHGSSAPSAADTAMSPTDPIPALARPVLLRGVAPAAIVAVLVVGALRRRRRGR